MEKGKRFMKQINCPHFVRMSGTQYYCMKGNFPVDCYKCDCPDKKEIEVTITTASSFDCKDCTNRKGCINCENGELREYKPVAKKEAEGNLKKLIDEMKSDAEVADDLGITPEQYRDMVTDMLFEPKEINPSEFDKRLNSLLKEFESLPKEDLIDSLEFYLNVVKEKQMKEAEERYKQGYHDAFVKVREWLEENLICFFDGK